jgi:hemoglobin-like flavoprotein
VPIGDTAADLFYRRLFSIAPEVQMLFPRDLSEQKKKLMQMLAAVVTNLHRFETIIPAAQNLGRRHSGYGVMPRHYEAVGAALLWALEQGLGSAFTPQVREAWTAAYAAIADVMKGAAADGSGNVGSHQPQKGGARQRENCFSSSPSSPQLAPCPEPFDR